MFLKRFKDKSNQKYINKTLNSGQSVFDNKTIASVGVLMYSEEFIDYNKFRQLISHLGVNENKIKFMTFVEDHKNEMNTWDDSFSAKDVGWSGKLTSASLQDFVNTEFDILISYYNSEALNLQLITASSKAKFKIGITSIDERFFDLIINVASKDVDVFQQELNKYLKILNKI